MCLQKVYHKKKIFYSPKVNLLPKKIFQSYAAYFQIIFNVILICDLYLTKETGIKFRNIKCRKQVSRIMANHIEPSSGTAQVSVAKENLTVKKNRKKIVD